MNYVNVNGLYVPDFAVSDLQGLMGAFATEFGKPLTLTSAMRRTGLPTDAAANPAQTQWAVYNYYKLHGTPLAAVPGTSHHEDTNGGYAIDFGSGVESFGTSEHSWLTSHGPEYGYSWGAVPSEPWHFEHPTRSPVHSVPVIRKENADVITVKNQQTGDVFSLDTLYLHHLGTPADADLLRKVSSVVDELQVLSDEQLATVFSAYGVPNKYRDAKVLRAEHPDGIWAAARGDK